MKHGWRDRAAAALDRIEAEAARVRDAAAAEYLAAAAATFRDSGERELARLRLHAEAGAYRLSDGTLTELALYEGAGREAVERHARAAGAVAEAEYRASLERHRRPRPSLVKAYKRAKLSISEHTRAAGKLRSGAALSPEALSSKSEQSAKRCEKTWVLVKCGCGMQPARCGCGSADCVDCTERVSARRARRARQRIAVERPEYPIPPHPLPRHRIRRGEPVHYVCFTIPAHLRTKATDREWWMHLAREAWGVLRDLGFTWAIEATHPVGDKGSEAHEEELPGDGDPATFHPHLNFLAVRPPAPGQRWKLDLPALRRAWATVLGVDAESILIPHVEILFPQSQDEDDRKRWSHCTRYVLRPFPGWQGGWLPSVRWFGKFPRGVVYTCPCPMCRDDFTIIATGDDALAVYFRRAAELGIDLGAFALPEPAGQAPPLPDEVNDGP